MPQTNLLINTATEQKEIAVFDGNVWQVATWEGRAADLENLLPQLDKLLKQTNQNYSDITGVVVVDGPGSFTALRLGIATANTIAQELAIPLYTIGTISYIQARLAQPTKRTLLKAGGDKVHIFDNTEYRGQLAIAEVEASEKVPAVDFTARLNDIWNKPTLTSSDWQSITNSWKKITSALILSDGPVVPSYFKEPSITLKK